MWVGFGLIRVKDRLFFENWQSPVEGRSRELLPIEINFGLGGLSVSFLPPPSILEHV